MERATGLEPASGIPRMAGHSREPCRTSHLTRLRRRWRQRVLSLVGKSFSCTGKPVNKKWSGRRGSNPLPPPWQGGALPDELRPQNTVDYSKVPPVCQWQIKNIPRFLPRRRAPGGHPGPNPRSGQQQHLHQLRRVLVRVVAQLPGTGGNLRDWRRLLLRAGRLP